MNELSNGIHRSPTDVIFFVLCFFGLLVTVVGVLTFAPWCAALGILTIAVGLAYFGVCQFL